VFSIFSAPEVLGLHAGSDVVVSGLTAQVMFQAVMTERERGGDILPEALGANNFAVHLSDEHGTLKQIVKH